MDHGSLTDPAYRNGEWGPAYLIEGGTNDIGVLLMRPGDAMPNHLHRHCDESFVVLEGAGSLWIDCRERHPLTPDGVYRCPAGEMHHLVNDGPDDLRLIFIKSPSSPGDTVVVEWTPGDPIPEPPSDDAA